jgi:hypothetical protein|tara:strand:+ start:4668 stop:5933 length:1266 start_codon:yes stop_codon:yes gene_type:complete
MAEPQEPIALDVQQTFRTLDPATRELFYGSGIPGTASFRPGFLQQAFQASNRTFFDEQGNPIIAPQRVAGLSPEQARAIQLSRQATGIQTPFLEQAGQSLGTGLETLFGGLGEARDIARGAEAGFGTGLDAASEFLRRGGTGQFSQDMTQQFLDPFEQAVVDQTREDILEAGAKQDIQARASDIARGGESAFGSRARLGATERQEALGRGLGEALAGIRSRGFQQAQQSALGEFGRQQQALTGLGGSLAGVAGQRAAGLRGLGSTIAGLGQTGQQALFGAGSAVSNLGTQAQQAAQADIQRSLGIGGLTQGQQQAQLDAARANAMQQQMAPLQQMQSLLPFVSAVPAGFSNIQTQFGTQPSPLMAGLGAGLSTLGGLGSFFNPPQTNINYGSPQTQQEEPAPPIQPQQQTPPPSFQQGFGF